MTPDQLLRSISDDELSEAVKEVIEWRRRGTLSGLATARIATKLEENCYSSPDESLRDADRCILLEAARRYAGVD